MDNAARDLADRDPGRSPDGFDRRAFLKLAGFSLGGAALAGCTRGREEKLVPYLVRPEEITPGRSTWYASTCGACSASCGILTKNRDGRPIKLEGLEHPLSRGGLCAIGQASVLGLYDSKRLTAPAIRGESKDWTDVDAAVRAELETLRAAGAQGAGARAVRFLSRTIVSPTLRATVESFLSTFTDGKLVEYDTPSASALLDAQEAAYGVRALPHFHFDRAQVVVGFEADFLGTWISPVEFTAAYAQAREPGDSMAYHAQIESRLSVTGSNADDRRSVRPTELPGAIAQLGIAVARKADVEPPWAELSAAPLAPDFVDALATRLWNAPRGQTLVVCGSNDHQAQQGAAWLNDVLRNAGSGPEVTIDLRRPSYQLRGNDRELSDLLAEIRDGKVGALLVHDANPIYDLPGGADLATDLAKIPVVVSFAERIDETAAHAHFACPDHHFLEGWSDSEPVAGIVSITQPVIRPLGRTRSTVESLAAWTSEERPHLDILRDHWRREILPRAGLPDSAASLDQLWDATLQRGFAEIDPAAGTPSSYQSPALDAPAEPRRTGFELLVYEKVGLRDGRHAHNAWLQELPDPITKVAWDNYASVAPALAEEIGVETGDVVRLTRTSTDGGTAAVELPVLIQPGQNASTVAVALGYGRKGTDRFLDVGPQWIEARPTVAQGETVGVKVAPLLSFDGNSINLGGAAVEVTPTGETRTLARTQDYHSLEVPEHLATGHAHPRPIAQETTLSEYQKDPGAGGHPAHEFHSIWPEDHTYDGHHWAMAIDLSRCTGCSACVIGCQAENNVPVVGKDEVARHREMSWIRIDRYYRR